MPVWRRLFNLTIQSLIETIDRPPSAQDGHVPASTAPEERNGGGGRQHDQGVEGDPNLHAGHATRHSRRPETGNGR